MNLLKIQMVIALILTSASVFAGVVRPVDVEVDLENGFAMGDTFTARNAREENVFIGCGIRNYEDGLGGVFKWGFCQAEDAEGDRATCLTFNPALVEAMGANSDYSFITFRWVDNGGDSLECTSAGSSTQSFYLPRK